MHVFEEIITQYSQINDGLTKDALKFIALSFRARDKLKVAYSLLVNRTLSNIIMLLDGIRPRGIDEGQALN